MIYVRDKGRMCNNILQYGHVYAWAKDNGKRTISMRFAYKYPWFRICRTPGHNFFRYLMGKFGAKWGLIPVASYNTENADYTAEDRLLLESRNAVAEGWWVRHYDSFLNHLGEIKEMFEFRPEVRKNAETTLNGARRAGIPAIGLHIRRGDYARWNGGRYFYSDDQYIEIARKLVEYAGGKADIFICGNDPSLDEAAFRKALESGKAPESGKSPDSDKAPESDDIKLIFPKGNPAEDLCLLSECDMLAGPPSTFTLVAAMYRDLPLYWVKDPGAPLDAASFSRFARLFREIL